MTITVTPVVQASNVPPRVQLTVSASAGETSTTVTRVNPDGSTTTVRTLDGNPLALSGGTGLLFDYEMPFGQGVYYSSTTSPATISAQVTVNVSSAWLIHPGVPDLSVPIDFWPGTADAETWDVRQAVLQPIGRKFPWVATDGQRKAPASSLSILVDSADDLASLRSLLADTNILQLNVPPSLGLGVDTAYIAVGAVTNRRMSSLGTDPYRALILPYQVVDRPAGGTTSERVWNDVTAAYASWNAVTAAYTSWNALLAGP